MRQYCDGHFLRGILARLLGLLLSSLAFAGHMIWSQGHIVIGQASCTRSFSNWCMIVQDVSQLYWANKLFCAYSHIFEASPWQGWSFLTLQWLHKKWAVARARSLPAMWLHLLPWIQLRQYLFEIENLTRQEKYSWDGTLLFESHIEPMLLVRLQLSPCQNQPKWLRNTLRELEGQELQGG